MIEQQVGVMPDAPPEQDRSGAYIRMRSGARFYHYDARPGDLSIQDIAAALAKQCRFSGHSRFHYSVAQHSIYVSRMLPKPLKLVGLMHDCIEAVLVDFPRPVKQAGILGQLYRALEEDLWATLAPSLGLPDEIPEHVHYADAVMCATELGQLMHGYSTAWPARPSEFGPIVPRRDLVIQEWTPRRAEREFLARYNALRK